MDVYVNQSGCIACGMCVGIEPDVFHFNEDGLAEVHGPVTPDVEEAVQRAIDSCPVSVIHEK